MNRGIERGAIFLDRRDREHFLELLGETVERYRFRMHAFCLMENHYHLLLQTPDANLSRGMQWLGLSYSSWFNARHERVGHLFQGRFKSVPVEDGRWALEVSWYVHLNPVRMQALGLDKRRRSAERVGIQAPPTPEQVSARLKRLREYPWSSYRAYAGYVRGPEWLTASELLRRSERRIADRRRAYRERVQRILRQGIDATRLEQFRDVLAVGSAEFVERIREGASGADREIERRGRLKDRVSVEQVVSVLEDCRGEPREEWLDRHGDWGKWLVLRIARAHSGLTLAELGEAVGGRDYAAVSMGLKYFEQKLDADRSLRQIRDRVERILNL